MIEFASVVPFHYSDDRTEYGFIVVGTHYNDLVKLLTDPQAVLFAERTSHTDPGMIPPFPGQVRNMAFPFHPRGPQPPFWMETPVTAIIRHGYEFSDDEKNEGKAIGLRDTGAGRLLGAIVKSKQLKQGDKVRIPTETPHVPLQSASNLQAFFEDGAFVCEFAQSTRCLYITYFRSLNGQGSFESELTDLTLCIPQLTLPTKPPIAIPMKPTVHFDLKTRTPSARAEFIGQMLENPSIVLKKVNEKLEYELSKPPFAERGIPFLEVDIPSTVKGSPSIKRKVSTFPDIFAEGLSTGTLGDSQEVEPCTVWELRIDEETGEYYWVLVIVKTYEETDAPSEVFAHQGSAFYRLVSSPKPPRESLTKVDVRDSSNRRTEMGTRVLPIGTEQDPDHVSDLE